MTPTRRGRLATRGGRLLGLAALAAAGCGEAVEPSLVVATPWPAWRRARVEADYLGAAGSTARIRWVVLDPADPVGRLRGRRSPPDVVLGGPIEAHRGFVLLDGTETRQARRAVLGSLRAEGAVESAGPSFDDPRRDPVALAWCRATLAGEGWPAGYGRLVEAAVSSARIGMQAGASVTAVGRGAVAEAVATEPEETGSRVAGASFVAGSGRPVWVEGVSALGTGRHPEAARAFLERFEPIGPAGDPVTVADDAGASLLADLLGATLVEAHNELRAARAALAASGVEADASRAGRWMTEPPPWPPASVARMLRRDALAMAMVETLAVQLAPDADARAWLIRSWLAPARPIDGAFLDELARAVDGRLAREPRLRAWLRAEWSAWARQRYRRVARLAEAGPP